MNKRILWICLGLITLIIPAWLCETGFIGFKFDSDFVSSNPDGLHYYRIVEQAISQKSTEPLIYDSYGNFPYKHKIGYPPLYIRFFYWAKCLCNKISAENSDFMLGFVPVVFGWLTAVAIILALWHCGFPRVFILFLAFAMIPLYPGLVACEYGSYDYDYFVSFFMWVWLLSAILYYEKTSWLWLIIGGLSAGILLGSWIGALLIFLIITFSCLGVWLFNSKICGKYLKYGYVTTAITVLLNSCMIAVSPNDYGFAFLDFGWFHVLCVAAASIFIFALTRFKPNLRNRLIFVFGAFGALIVTCLTMGDGFADLFDRFFASDPVFMHIAELRPMIRFSNLFTDLQAMTFALINLSWTVFFLPIFVLLPVDRLLKKESSVILQIWLSVMILAGMVQIRYIRLPAMGCSIFIAIIIYLIWKSYFTSLGKNNRNYLAFGFGFVILLLFVRVPSSLFFHGFDSKLGNGEKIAFDWISKNTKPTSGFYDNKKPEYAILAYWDLGHLINAYAHRPVIANNCQWGMKNMAEIFSSTSEKEANELCKKLKVKYVFLTPNRILDNEIIDFWPAYKKLPEHDGYRALSSDVERSKDLKSWFYFWLKKDFGLQKNNNFDVSSNFRIVYAHYNDNIFAIANNVLFERVEGAKLYLNAKPDTEASVNLNLAVAGKRMKYNKTAIVPQSGVVCFTLPYSCYFNNGVVATDELYTISVVSRETEKKISGKVIVKEKDVIEGNQVATHSIRLFR